jgi:PKD repeat protein
MAAALHRFTLLLLVTIFLCALPLSARGAVNPVIVRQAASDTTLAANHQIIRTSTGKIYYFTGNAGHTSTWDGWIEVNSSPDGSNWTAVGSRDEWHAASTISAAVDSRNYVHLLTYTWNNQPAYTNFFPEDVPGGNNSWSGAEPLESSKAAVSGRGAIAVDNGDNPHVVYTLQETYKGKSYTTLTYANRVGNVWNTTVIWPKENKISFTGKFDIVIGPDNIPYILAGSKVFKGNGNNPTAFETKDLGVQCYSMVVHANGDLRLALAQGGYYANYLHGNTQPWASGWTLTTSTTTDAGGTLILASDQPYLARLLADGIWLQKGFEPPILAAAQPPGVTWQSLTARWSRFNQSLPGVIDLGTRSWSPQTGNQYWYARYNTPTEAGFSATPLQGAAPLKVTFTDKSHPEFGSSINSWSWDFNGDGQPDASTGQPTYLYSIAGKYPVSLHVTDTNGSSATKTITDFIEVLADSDDDGIIDKNDNCPNDYNPLQTDLNGNGIGDVCETALNRVAKVVHMTGLRSLTAADSRKSTDVTGLMTDGQVVQGVNVAVADNSAISIQMNKDARNIRKLVLRIYVDGIAPYDPRVGYLYIMPYNSNLSSTVDAGLVGGFNGWNEVDVTSIMHRMDGFGVVKFRVAALRQSFTIREVELVEKIDDKELTALPERLDFGPIEIPGRVTGDITVANNGAETLNIVRTKPPAAPFYLDSDGCTGKSLASYTSCTLKVSFQPGYNIDYQGALTIDSDDAEISSKRIPLTGIGTLILSGKVTDSFTGYPLSNVTVATTDSSGAKTAVTDKDGNYRITGMSPGSCTVAFSRADYRNATSAGNIVIGAINRLDATMTYNYGSIGGTVTDQATGQPLAGVTVSLAVSGIRSKDPVDTVLRCNSGTNFDTTKLFLNDGVKSVCSSNTTDWASATLMARNPFGKDPFTINWNGIGALSSDVPEYLAQSFKPTKNGKLTKITLYMNTPYSTVGGYVHVLLKSKLGGDRGSYLAISNQLGVRDAGSSPTFTFPKPVDVIAGQEYFIEINGTFFDWIGLSGYLYGLGWMNATSYPDGRGYKRVRGDWLENDSPLAFQVYIDDQTNAATQPATSSSSMYGGNVASVSGVISNSSGSEGIPFLPFGQFSDNDGERGYNGDDLTVAGAYSDNLDRLYNADGWVIATMTAYVYQHSSALAIDQFDITFNRSLTVLTDSSGAYRFPDLPEGNYTLTVGDAAYRKQTFTGVIASGVNIVRNVAVDREPAPTLKGKAVSGTGGSQLAGVTVTVSCNGGSQSTTTGADGAFLIGGLTAGPFTATLVKTGFETAIIRGELSNYTTTDAGNIYLLDFTGAPPVLTLAPEGGIVFGTVPLTDSTTRTIVIGNSGTGDLIVRQPIKPAAPFMLTGDGCSGRIIPTGGSCRLEIRFLPASSGPQSASITVNSNDPAMPQVIVPLSGMGSNGYLLPDTAQSSCYDNTDRLTPCINTFGQDGNKTFNPLSYAVVSPGVVKDNNTGLFWQKNMPSAVYTWQGATDYCVSLVLDGLSGWRLPTHLELLTLVDYSLREPAINSQVFPTDPYAMFWSSSSGETIWNEKKYLNIEFGDSYYRGTNNVLNVRCVRGTPLQEGLIVDNHDGTATDTETGLTWTKDFVSTGSTWNEALALPNGLTYAGYSDWRLPNVKELSSYLQYPYYDENGVWTSTTQLSEYPSGTYRYAMVSGNELINGIRKDHLYSVRLVRGGNRHPVDSQTITVSPLAHDFGTVAIGANGSRVITINNSGGAPLTIGQIPGLTAPFGMNSNTCSGRTLAPEGSCTFNITFDPSYGGSFAAVTTIPSDDADRPVVEMALTGMALPVGAAISGNLFDRSTGLPVAGANVVVTDGANNNHNAVTDNSGRFYIASPAPGLFTVTIDKSGYVQLSWSGALNMGQHYDTSRTLAQILPEIGNVAATTPAADRADITWTTGTTSNGRVEYGLTSAYGGSATAQTATGTTHTATLTGLLPTTTYHYRIIATNGYGNSVTTADATFTTPLFTARHIADSGNIAIMEASGNYDAKNQDGSVNDLPRQTVAKEYFKNHSDQDFLVFLSTFDYALPESGAQGFYLPVRNDVQGINQPLMDNTVLFGSVGKLQGTIDLGNVTPLASSPSGPKRDETLITMSHEVMHRFGAYVRFRNPDGTLNTALLGKDSSHWSYLLDSKGSLMYGNGWKDNGDGTFTSTSSRSAFSPLDLYLMGMIDKGQVPPMLLINNGSIDKTQLPHLGATVSGTAQTVTIDDIIAAEGARIPDTATSQKQFNIGFVLLIRPGDNAAVATQAVETLRKGFAGRFAELTQGKGSVGNVAASLEIAVDSPGDGATITGPDVMVSGTVINSTGAETGVTVNGLPATVTGSRFLANRVPLQHGSNTIEIKATDANGMTTTTTRSVIAQAGHYLRISSNIDSGTGPLEVRLRLDASFVIANPQIMVKGPATATLQAGTAGNDYVLKMIAEGQYTVTASITGPEGTTYSDDVTITVVSRNQLESLLQEKWEGIKSKIRSMDNEGAVSFFPASKQAYYRELFTVLGSSLPGYAEELPMPKLGAARDNMAKSLMTRQETVMGQQKSVSYLILFVKENGIWKIRQL